MNISIHRPKHKQRSFLCFSFFLAGIIDGDGHFSRIPQLVIYFFEKDIGVAYYLKKTLKYGIVRNIKNKKAVSFVISHSKGLSFCAASIRDKLQHPDKISQYNNRLTRLSNFLPSRYIPLDIKENSWFSGFFLSDGCFQIKILDREKRKIPEIRVVIQIDQKEKTILETIQKAFGGSIGFRKSQKSYIYSSDSFKNAEKIISYFDIFPLMGVKQIQYIFWRRAYVKIQEKAQPTHKNIEYFRLYKEKIRNVAKT